MSDNPDVTDTKVVEVEADKEVKTELDPKIKALETDNFKQREEIREYKAKLEELTNSFTELKTSLEAKQEESAKAEKEASLANALTEAGIVDEKARTLAIKMLDDSNGIEAGIKTLIEDYPFITGKKKVTLPDTGNTRTTDEVIPDNQKIRQGLSKLINGD